MEQKLIDANELLENSFNTGYEYGEISVVGTTHIENTPTIDPVYAANACYCRECKWKHKNGHCVCEENIGVCHSEEGAPYYTFLQVKNDHFCSFGERKQDEILD